MILVLFLLLGNFRAALITALVIPIAMLLTMTGMVEGKITANLMSLGALDFGLIVDGAVIIAENSLRHLAERQHAFGRQLTQEERLGTIIKSAEEMIKPSVFGQAIIILVYVPLLTFSGIEGKMFEPMALTVIIALAAAFVLSLTFVPAMIAIVITGRIQEKENFFVRWMKVLYEPALSHAIRSPLTFIGGAVVLLIMAGLLFTRLGQVFIPTLDEKNIVMNALRIPSTSLSQSQAMTLMIEKVIRRFPQVAVVFSKTGTAEAAMDPMPPNTSDTLIMLKPREEWPDPELTKDRGTTADRRGCGSFGRQYLRILAADPNALQRIDRGCARRRCHQGLRRRVRADVAGCKPNRRHIARSQGRRGRQGRAGDGAARSLRSRSTKPRSPVSASVSPRCKT